MTIDYQQIIDLVAKYQNKVIGDKELSDWSCGLLARGIESQSLILLAGLSPSEESEACELLKKAIPELGFSWPSDRLIGLAYSKIIAQRILDGAVDPNSGCAEIGVINQSLQWPDELSVFGLLAHEQCGHEKIGITAAGCIPDIVAEARKLLGNVDQPAAAEYSRPARQSEP